MLSVCLYQLRLFILFLCAQLHFPQYFPLSHCLSTSLCRPRFTSHHNRIHISQGLDKEQWEGLDKRRENPPFHLAVSISACRPSWGLVTAPQVSANHCYNPVSPFTRSMIDYFGLHSCSEIVCMSYFMHVGLRCLPVCLHPSCRVML